MYDQADKPYMEYFEIKRKSSDFIHFFLQMIIGGCVMLFLTIILFYKDHCLAGCISTFIYLRHYVYTYVDFLLPVRIIEKDDKLYVRYFFCKLKLDIENSFLIIENISAFTGARGPNFDYALVLVRNHANSLNKIFKNRIKLIRGMDIPGLEDKMKLIHDKFQIRYVPFFPDPFGGML